MCIYLYVYIYIYMYIYIYIYICIVLLLRIRNAAPKAEKSLRIRNFNGVFKFAFPCFTCISCIMN